MISLCITVLLVGGLIAGAISLGFGEVADAIKERK